MVRLIKSLSATCQLVGLRQVYRRAAMGLAVFSLVLVWLGTAWAGAGALDLSFDPGPGVQTAPMLWGQMNYHSSVGKMMITGSFKEIGPETEKYARRSIARLYADGRVDPSFDAAIASYSRDSGYVNGCMLVNWSDPFSQMIICGDFVIDSDSGPYYGLARLNWDGSVDPSFAHTFSTGDGVQTFTRQSSGDILVGGYAMKVNGYPNNAYFLVRVDSNGNVDNNFMFSAPGGHVYAITAYSDTDLNFPGHVRLLGTIPRPADPPHVDYLQRYDKDGNLVMHLGDEALNGPILDVMGQSDGKVIIAGSFTQVYGQTRNNVARLNAGLGSRDDSFNVGTGANGHVKLITIEPSGKIVLNGYFNSFNGTPCGYMVRLINDGVNDGAVDPDFNAGGSGADDRIWNANRQSDDSWVILGAFKLYNGTPRQCLAALTNTGTLNADRFASFTTGTEPSSPVPYGIRFAPVGGGIYVFGALSGYGGKLHRRVARVNYSNGGVDGSCRAGLGGVVYDADTEWQDGGKLLVAGHFGVGTGYVGCTSLARLNNDGSMDLNFRPVLAKADGSLPDLYLVQNSWDGSGDILVGGDFASVNGEARSGIVRLNSNGTLDTGFTFNPASMPGFTNIMVTHTSDDTGGPLRVFGKATYQGSTVGFMARLLHGGSLDTSFANGLSPVPHVVIFNGEVKGGFGDENTGVITVGGAFTQIIGGDNPPP